MTTQFNPRTTYGKRISRGKAPSVPGMLSIPLDFTIDTDILVDINVLDQIKNVSGLGGIQSVFIDNSNNSTTVSITLDNGPRLVCPANGQAVFPVFFSGEKLKFDAQSTGNILVPTWWINTREQAQLWSAKIPVGGTISVTGSTVFTEPGSGAFTDSSGVLVAGGTSQPLMVANGNRLLIAIRNPALGVSQGFGAGSAPEPAYINFGAAAAVNGATSWELLPGESLPNFLMTTTQAINWVAATTGHQLIAKYM